MSNLGFQNLLLKAGIFSGIRVARFFYQKTEGLFSPEFFNPREKDIFPDGKLSFQNFDACFFSVSYELDYLNILRMLALSSVHPLSRRRDKKGPIIVVGGITVTANPFVISPFADIAYLGDMEVGLEKIFGILLEAGFEKSEKLYTKLGEIEGVYIPSIRSKPPRRAIWTAISNPAHSAVITGKTQFSNMFLVELVRGCKNYCTFCMTRCIASPVRTFSQESILRVVKKAKEKAVRVGLIAPVLQDHPQLVEIVKNINRMDFQVSFSSLRADMFNQDLAELLVLNKQKSITFAPETGSDELRKRIGKSLKNEELIDAVALAVEKGIRKFRYYIMYGLPGEKEKDIRCTLELVKKTISLFRFPDCSLHLSINPFVPKKSTPLAGEGIFTRSYYSNIRKELIQGLKSIKKVHVKFESLRLFYIQVLLSTGDRETGELLYSSFVKNSYRPLEEAVGKLKKTIDF